MKIINIHFLCDTLINLHAESQFNGAKIYRKKNFKRDFSGYFEE